MIRINLAKGGVGLPNRGNESLSTSASGDVYLHSQDELKRKGLVHFLIILIFPSVLFVYERSIIPEKEEKIAKGNQELNELVNFNQKAQDSVQEIQKFTEEQAKVKTRIDALNKLSVQKSLDIRVIDLFQQAVPEKLWLTQIESNGERIIAKGLATNDVELNTFTDRLQQSIFFKQVEIISSAEEKSEDMLLKRFEISCVLRIDKSQSDGAP